jgi:hypothetical protein
MVAHTQLTHGSRLSQSEKRALPDRESLVLGLEEGPLPTRQREALGRLADSLPWVTLRDSVGT